MRMRLVFSVGVCAVTANVTEAVDRNWGVQFGSGDWSQPTNWLQQIEPTISDDAFHDNTNFDSSMEVDDAAACAKLMIDGSEPSSRFLVVEAQKLLSIGSGGLIGTGGRDVNVKFEDGASGTRSRVLVGGPINDMQFLPASGASGHYVEIKATDAMYDVFGSRILFSGGNNGIIDVEGDLRATPTYVGNSWDIDVGGNVEGVGRTALTVGDSNTVDIVGDVFGVVGSVGNSSQGPADKSTVTIEGSLGLVGNALSTTEDWTIKGYSELVVETDFTAAEEFAPTIEQLDNSSMTVHGVTDRARWDMSGNSEFTGKGSIQQGEWNVFGDARVVAEEGIVVGSETKWNIRSDGGGGLLKYGVHAQAEDATGVAISGASLARWTIGTTQALPGKGTLRADGDVAQGTWDVVADSEVSIHGDIVGGAWAQSNTSLVKMLDSAGSVTGSKWSIDGNARAEVSGDISGGGWAVRSDGSGTEGLLCSGSISFGKWTLGDPDELSWTPGSVRLDNTLGVISQGAWNIYDSSEIVSSGDVDAGTWHVADQSKVSVDKITGGMWTVLGSATVTAINEIDGGVWEVQSEGSANDSGVNAHRGVVGGEWTLGDSGPAVVSGTVETDSIFPVHITGGIWDLYDSSSMNINGEIDDGEWTLRDDSTILMAHKVINGVWTIEDNAFFRSTSDVGGSGTDDNGGDWHVNAAGGPLTGLAMNAGTRFNPRLLTVDGGKVNVGKFGEFAGDQPLWPMVLRNGADVTCDEGYHNGDIGGSLSGDGSPITFEGLGNTYTVEETKIAGPLVKGSGDAELTIAVNAGNFDDQTYLAIGTVLEIASNGLRRQFDAEEVSVELHEVEQSVQGGMLEANGLDYDTFWYGDSVHDPGDTLTVRPVLFTDAVCVRAWDRVTVFDNGETTGTHSASLGDQDVNTPISGGQDETIPPKDFPEAVYTKHLDVNANAVLRLARLSSDCTACADKNIYYVDQSSGGSLQVSGSILDQAGQSYTVQSMARTMFGDFDGDQNSSCVDDQDDVAFFNAFWPCDYGDSGCTYNPLVDWNCDGVLDCVDWEKFRENYPNTTLVNSVDDDSGQACTSSWSCN